MLLLHPEWFVHPACVQLHTKVLCSYSCLSLQNGYNAFHLCAKSGDVTFAEFLAPMMGDRLFDISHSGYTALHSATQASELSMVEYLVKSCGFDLKAKDKVGPL